MEYGKEACRCDYAVHLMILEEREKKSQKAKRFRDIKKQMLLRPIGLDAER